MRRIILSNKLALLLFATLFSIEIFAQGSGNVQTMLSALQNLSQESDEFMMLIMGASYLMGIWLFIGSIFRLKKFGHLNAFQSMSAKLAGPLARMFIGVLLIYLPSFIEISVNTLYATGTSGNVLAYPSESGSAWESVITSVGGIIRVVGFFAFVRGWYLIAKSTTENAQPGTFGKGLTFVVGGLLAINIYGTVDLVQASLGL